MRKSLFVIGVAMLSLTATAQENEFSVDAQLRTRGEHNHGAITPINEGGQSANFVM